MDKAERSSLLRSRFKAIGGVPFVGKGLQPPRATPKPRGRVYMPWPDIIVDHKRTPLWAFEANPKTPLRIAPKRKARVSPLTRIAALYPQRNPRGSPWS